MWGDEGLPNLKDLNQLSTNDDTLAMAEWVITLRHWMWAVEYHTLNVRKNGADVPIHTLFADNAYRMMRMFDAVEKALIKKYPAGKKDAYTKQDYAQKWIEYLNRRKAAAQTKATGFINAKMTVLGDKMRLYNTDPNNPYYTIRKQAYDDLVVLHDRVRTVWNWPDLVYSS